jgi:hypothetical protein
MDPSKNEFYDSLNIPSAYMREVDRNILKIISKILKYYADIDTKEPKVYFANNECDSNQTSFEYYSNGDKIGIYTSLNEVDAEVVIMILGAILEQNFNRFDLNELKEMTKLSVEDANDLLSYNPKFFMKWIAALKGSTSGEIREYKKLPEHDESNEFVQSFLEVKDIKLNMRLTKKGIVEII